MDPTPRLLNSLGLTYKLPGKLHDALEWYGRAAESIVGGFQDQYRDQMLREQIIDGEKVLVMLPEAMDLMHSALRSDPRYAIVQNNMGACLAELGRVDEARARFLESIDCTPAGYDYPQPHDGLDALS